jgi:hypothetical protein
MRGDFRNLEGEIRPDQDSHFYSFTLMGRFQQRLCRVAEIQTVT